MSDAIDGTADEIGTDIVIHDQPGTLFRTDDPVQVLERATQVAQALKSVIDQQGLVSKIQGREHVRVEGWTTLGSMLGVVPVVTWTRRTEDGWEARVEARTLDGRTVGAAEAMCSKDERTWKSRDDYALRSMAQTRATSKALRGPLGFVVTLAGYEATPAEEMPSDGPRERDDVTQIKTLIRRNQITTKELRPLLRGLGLEVGDQQNPVPLIEGLTVQQAAALTEFLQAPIPTGDSDLSSGFPRTQEEAA